MERIQPLHRDADSNAWRRPVARDWPDEHRGLPRAGFGALHAAPLTAADRAAGMARSRSCEPTGVRDARHRRERSARFVQLGAGALVTAKHSNLILRCERSEPRRMAANTQQTAILRDAAFGRSSG